MTDSDGSDESALAEDIVRRAAERLTAGVRQQRRTLPDDKAQYPKLLCLDQNKWIDLARAHYLLDEGVTFRPALDAVREAVGKGTLVVPFTAANVYEAAEPANEARRERLARFMVDLSANHSLINHQIVMREELTRAIAVHYLKRLDGRLDPEKSVHRAIGREVARCGGMS
jgi:hypothetical protein